jgi:sortase (surface protein transpeptidase)
MAKISDVEIVKGEKKLNSNDIMGIICSLASSQGFYGRLFRTLYESKNSDKELYNKFMETFADKYTDTVDFVMALED